MRVGGNQAARSQVSPASGGDWAVWEFEGLVLGALDTRNAPELRNGSAAKILGNHIQNVSCLVN